MDFHRAISFLLLPLFLLFNHTTASAHQTTTETTIHPPGGSTITAFEYQQHIQIVCSITENSDIVDTLWTIHTASDLDNGGSFAYGSGSGDSSGDGGSGDDLPPDFEIIPENDIRFSIEGSGGSVLIINLFAPELNGSVIYCRERLMGELIANFTLRSTLAREVPLRLRGEELELEIEGEGCSAVDTTYFREPINRFIRQRLQLLAAQVNKDY